jgi:hypothetical protein
LDRAGLERQLQRAVFDEDYRQEQRVKRELAGVCVTCQAIEDRGEVLQCLKTT